MSEVRKIADYIVIGLLLVICFLILLLFRRKDKPVALTDHAVARMEERMGIKSESKMLRLAKDAYRYGKRAKHLPKKTAAKIRKKQRKYGGSTIAVYNGFMYVFSKDRALITVYKDESI